MTALLWISVAALLVALALDYDKTHDVFGRPKK
jgi:hypothetical protein